MHFGALVMAIVLFAGFVGALFAGPHVSGWLYKKRTKIEEAWDRRFPPPKQEERYTQITNLGPVSPKPPTLNKSPTVGDKDEQYRSFN
jgi:hypothetical protein